MLGQDRKAPALEPLPSYATIWALCALRTHGSYATGIYCTPGTHDGDGITAPVRVT